jgi:hypothetical protein
MKRFLVLTPSGSPLRHWPGEDHLQCLELATQLRAPPAAGPAHPTVLAVDDRSRASALLLQRLRRMKARHPQWLFAVLTCTPDEGRRLPLELWPASPAPCGSPQQIRAELRAEGVTFEFDA